MSQLVKNPPAMQETWIRSLGWEDPLEKGKANHSSILAWRIPWTCIVQGVAKSQTQLSSFHFHFSFFIHIHSHTYFPLLNTHTQSYIFRHTDTHTMVHRYVSKNTHAYKHTFYLVLYILRVPRGINFLLLPKAFETLLEKILKPQVSQMILKEKNLSPLCYGQ